VTKPSITMTVRKGVTVVRDGKRIRPEVNKTFDFTATERDSILERDASALVAADSADEGTAETASTTPAGSGAAKSQAKARGGSKAATSNKSDAETTDADTDADADKSGDDDL
jgi:hypothetical protein